MKILFVVKSLTLTNGVASYVMSYYRELIKKNVKVDFLEISPDGSPYYDEIKKNGSNVYYLPSYKSKVLEIPKFLNVLYKRERYDIVHCNTLTSGSLILRMAKKNKVPLRILHSHATVTGDSLLKEIRNYLFKKVALSSANCYFACSNLAGKSMFKNEPFYIINNALNIEKYKYNEEVRNKIRNKYKVGNKQIIMTAGRFTKQKNPWFIIDIIKQMIIHNLDFEFWWFGDGELEKQVKILVQKQKLDTYVRFFGSVKNLNDYYSSADLFILPSFFEGLPVVGIEAQISGLHCLFSDNITEEVKIGKTNCDFISICSSNEWVKYIDSKKGYDRLKNIEELDIKKYVIDEQVKELINIYKGELSKI